MRISTAQLYNRSIQSVLDNQANLSDTQAQLSSGKKFLRPSDDPVGASQLIRLTEDIDLLQQYNKNNTQLTNSLEQEETVLSSIDNAVNRARVLMIQSGNGIINSNDRKSIAIEMEQIRDHTFELMNSRNPAGEYIFAGFQSDSPAFSFNASALGNKYSFEGDQGENKIKVSDTITLQANTSGRDVFEDVFSQYKATITGSVGATSSELSMQEKTDFDKFHSANYDAVTAVNNEFKVTLLSDTQAQITNVGTGDIIDTVDFSSGDAFLFNGLEIKIEGNTGDTIDFQLDPPEKKNIAETLNDFINALYDKGISDSDFDIALADALVSVDNSLSTMGEAIAAIGGRMNVAESVLTLNLDLDITHRSARSNIEDVDYAEAVSELSRQEAALQAAQATFARVTGSTLFDFIR